MYQINLRAQAIKLASLTTRWQLARAQRSAATPRRPIQIHRVVAALSKLAALRAIPGCSADAAARPDPRDPRNW